MWGISWLAANQLASQEGLCTVEQVSKCVMANLLLHIPLNITHLYVSTWRLEVTVRNESVCGRKTSGPGNRNPGRNRMNANVSCSKKLRVPSSDWTHRKSLPLTPPKAPNTIQKADLCRWCSYTKTKRIWSPRTEAFWVTKQEILPRITKLLLQIPETWNTRRARVHDKERLRMRCENVSRDSHNREQHYCSPLECDSLQQTVTRSPAFC